MPIFPFVKICGITNTEDLEVVLPFFPDAVGMIFTPLSYRHISTELAKQLSQRTKNFFCDKQILTVGVFVDQSVETVKSVVFEAGIDVVQLHGNESPEYCSDLKKKFPQKQIWKAFRISKEEDLPNISDYSCCDRLLFDAFSREAHGGTGKQIASPLLPDLRSACPAHVPFLIAGGINAENFAHILSLSGADGIDLSSSLEEFPGKKSQRKVQEFFTDFQKQYF